jgi:hypothetical protein
MNQTESTYRRGYAFGIGVESASGSPMGLVVTGTPAMVRDATGGEGSFQFTRIATTSELEDHLGISAAASGGIGLFSASDRFNFAKDCKIQSNSITLLLYCTREFGFEQIDDPRLSESAASIMAKGNLQLFQGKYGDCFVRGIATGGQFFGVVRIDCKSEDSRQTIENSLSGSYGTLSADVAVKVSSALKATSSHAETYIHYEGGDVKTIVDTPEKLFAAATEWLNSLAASRKPYSVTLAPYIIADGPEPPNKADLQHQQDVLARCAILRSKTIDKQNLIDYMMSPQHAGDFDIKPDSPNLSELAAKISNDLDIIASAASFAIENPKDALEPEDYARQKKGLAGYTLTQIPANIPKLKDGVPVTVPDFRPLSYQDASSVASSKQLSLQWVTVGDPNQPWHISSQDPPPGAQVNPGATVTLAANFKPARIQFSELAKVRMNPVAIKAFVK